MTAGADIVLPPRPDLSLGAPSQTVDRSPRWRDAAPPTVAGALLVLGIAVVDGIQRHSPGSALVLAVLGCSALTVVSVGLPALLVRRWSRAIAVPDPAGPHPAVPQPAGHLGVADLLDLERRRLARELHDVGAAGVTAMIVQAAAASSLVGRDDDAARRALAAVQRLGATAMGEIYQLVSALRHDAAESIAAQADSPYGRGWSDIDGLIADLGGTGLQVEVSGIDDVPPLDPQVELAGYRVVQESLTNALKHTARREVSITATVAGEVRLEVASRGPALPGPRSPLSSGAGLRGLRERVEGVGGGLEVRSDGDRFVVCAVLPLPGPVSAGRRR